MFDRFRISVSIPGKRSRLRMLVGGVGHFRGRGRIPDMRTLRLERTLDERRQREERGASRKDDPLRPDLHDPSRLRAQR